MRVSPCQKWLHQYLVDNGPTKSADVKAAGVVAGFPTQMVSRAAKAIGVISERERVMQSFTTWRLPNADQLIWKAVGGIIGRHNELADAIVAAHKSTPGGTDATALASACHAAGEVFTSIALRR